MLDMVGGTNRATTVGGVEFYVGNSGVQQRVST